MKQLFKQLYLTNFFFYCLIGIIGCFVLSYFFPMFYNASWYILYVLIVFTSIDILMLFMAKSPIEAVRETPEKLSNGDENEIIIRLKNYGG